jgi:hypothetical protein
VDDRETERRLRPGHLVSGRPPPAEGCDQITTNLATVSPRYQRPDHHEPCDQITTRMPEVMASPDAM